MSIKQISQYRIIGKIGSGGMGEVYQARDPVLGRIVAIKVLKSNLTSDTHNRQKFLNEARLAAAIDHPNLCTIYAVNKTSNDQLYICMAYYTGETLETRMNSGEMDFHSIIGIGETAARGLKALHDRQIIHRDIKPANIMITGDGILKILDFGLARLADQPGLTRSGLISGSPNYMAPEQALGKHVDHRADIWALGVILYRMTAGRRPFEKECLVSTLHSVVYDAPEPVSQIRRDVPDLLEQIIERAMQKNRKIRYQDIDAMINDLVRLRIQLTGSDPHHPPAVPLSPVPDQHPDPEAVLAPASDGGITEPDTPLPDLDVHGKFIGRTRELKEIRELIRKPDCRLLTLTGMGGSANRDWH